MTTLTLYTARRVPIPPLVVATAFDALRLSYAEGAGSTRWTVVAPSAVLVLTGSTLVPTHPTLPLRRAPGRLRTMSGWRWFPVEVEVTARSQLDSEVGVRACGRSVSLDDGFGQRRYLRLAHAIADHLASTLVAVVAAWAGDDAAIDARADVGAS